MAAAAAHIVVQPGGRSRQAAAHQHDPMEPAPTLAAGGCAYQVTRAVAVRRLKACRSPETLHLWGWLSCLFWQCGAHLAESVLVLWNPWSEAVSIALQCKHNSAACVWSFATDAPTAQQQPYAATQT